MARETVGQVVVVKELHWSCRASCGNLSSPALESDQGTTQELLSEALAYATIKGLEVMRALRNGQARMFAIQVGVVGEVRIVERAFGVGPCALTEACLTTTPPYRT